MTSESQPPNDADDRKPDETQAQPNRATSDASAPSSSGSNFDSVQSTATNDLLLKIQSAPKLDQERFRAEDEIGKGGVGAVTRVHDKVLNRSLAMKTLLDRAAPRDEEERRMESQRLGRFLMQRWLNCQGRPSAPSCASLHKCERAPRAYISRFICVFDEVHV